jgi:large-conductance mechanosensitive channel
MEMADDSADHYERFGLLNSTVGLSNSSVMIQEILAYLVLATAVLFLVKKFFFKAKKKKNCSDDGCGCH